MASEMSPDLSLDESYWQSLLNDVEAFIPERTGDGRRPLAEAPPRRDEMELLWQAAQRASDASDVIQVQSIGSNRGGLLIEWNGLRGFMPASHLCSLSQHLSEEARRIELAQRVGQCFPAKVIELDRGQSRFVVSERLACTEHNRREALLTELAEGQVREGAVTNVCSFGVFVDLGGLEGLLHISEISWGRVNHPGDLLKIGQRMRVLLMSVDRSQNRVALSIKRLSPDPWLTVGERYNVGQIVSGVVTSVVAFGAFTRLEDGLEGLIHVSELAEGNFLHPRNVVCEGQSVRVRVLNIDGAHRRLGLSLRQVNGEGGALGV
ncbi:MAG TPA: S1 RNA-binding domain-containing protein [Anaerolineae bacterium]|nr:S1 RNA-binding domain-containing protein [Anaerolineae bacterium]